MGGIKRLRAVSGKGFFFHFVIFGYYLHWGFSRGLHLHAHTRVQTDKTYAYGMCLYIWEYIYIDFIYIYICINRVCSHAPLRSFLLSHFLRSAFTCAYESRASLPRADSLDSQTGCYVLI